MASDESMTLLSSLHDDLDYDDTTDDGSSDLHRLPHISRLSRCSSSVYTNDDDPMRLSMSRLSIEGFDADDEEFSDAKDDLFYSGDDDSDNEDSPCYYSLSLPSTPRRRRKDRTKRLIGSSPAKDYASENDAGEKAMKSREKNCGSSTTVGGSCSGESESGGGGGKGLMVITRAKGGGRSLCMDMEEVKGCRDLGFELEMPSSSGADSPIANWRISSPGDDPRDVKARLKVWAQAVALASASRHCL